MDQEPFITLLKIIVFLLVILLIALIIGSYFDNRKERRDARNRQEELARKSLEAVREGN